MRVVTWVRQTEQLLDGDDSPESVNFINSDNLKILG